MTPWELQTRKYLDSVRIRDRLVADLQEEKDRLEHMIRSVGSPGTDEIVQKSPSADRLTCQLIRLDDKKAELAAAYDAYADFRIKVIKEIHNIPNEKQQIVLHRHYIQFQSFHTIEKETYFCYPYVTQLHRQGIQSFWKANKEVVENLSKKR